MNFENKRELYGYKRKRLLDGGNIHNQAWRCDDGRKV